MRRLELPEVLKHGGPQWAEKIKVEWRREDGSIISTNSDSYDLRDAHKAVVRIRRPKDYDDRSWYDQEFYVEQPGDRRQVVDLVNDFLYMMEAAYRQGARERGAAIRALLT